ncbi:DUF4097 family beta strand repeat-containing protein [Pseudofrankia sp. DC12]|uniref:DUF4097 family beta strand repeat-containing protein n=1 Tax=Pseudofrankia sp. DC12 TaxID=683315 RepID=UPI001E593C23|nr:DUF4097 family beta strand repeat-containing protein [Pseudofrankia sp. DC12]
MADTSTATAGHGHGGGPAAVRSAAGYRGARGVLLVLGTVLALGLTALAGSQALNWTTGRDKHDQHAVLPASITRLEVSTSSGNVILTGTDGGPAVVDAHLTSTIHAPSLRLDVSGGTAKVSARCGRTFTLSCGATLRITVPAGLTVVAHSSSGDIRATGLRGSLDLGTSSGNVIISGGSGTARLSTSSGDVRAAGLAATSVYAHSSSGNVSLRLTVVPDDVTATSSSGDVRVAVPDTQLPYLVTAHSSSGDRTIGVRTDPTAPRQITVRTSSGNVSVVYGPENQRP